jgi:hypothetical protein
MIARDLAAQFPELLPGDEAAADPVSRGSSVAEDQDAADAAPPVVDAPAETEIDLLRAANAELRQQNAAMAHSPRFQPRAHGRVLS